MPSFTYYHSNPSFINLKEHSQNSERSRKALEVQVSDLQTKLDQAEANALKGGKRLIQKLEQRVSFYHFF